MGRSLDVLADLVFDRFWAGVGNGEWGIDEEIWCICCSEWRGGISTVVVQIGAVMD